MAKSVCALIDKECPKTGDPTAKVFCPNWKDAIPEHEKDGSGRVVALKLYTGCQLPRLIPYLQSNTAEVDHAHAAANQARDATLELAARMECLEGSIRGILNNPLYRSLSALVGLGLVGQEQQYLLTSEISHQIEEGQPAEP